MIAAESLPRRLEIEFLRYLVCAVLALALDTVLFLGLHAFGVVTWIAASLGYLAGMVLIYGLSVRYVFSCRSFGNRRAEFLVFSAVGLASCVLNAGLLELFIFHLQWNPVWAKAFVASQVFAFNFGLRKALLFTLPRSLRT